MLDDVKPAAVPDYEAPEDPDDNLSHIIAISMDSAGLPIKLFTTNRWVTGEVWFTAADMHRLIGLFQIDHAQPSWPVNLWVTSMVQLFDPQIRALVWRATGLSRTGRISIQAPVSSRIRNWKSPRRWISISTRNAPP